MHFFGIQSLNIILQDTSSNSKSHLPDVPLIVSSIIYLITHFIKTAASVL